MIVWRGHRAKVRSLAFAPDSRLIATTAGESKFVWLWDATTGQLVRKLTISHNPVRVAAFIGDGRHILGIYEQLGGCIWEVETGESVARLTVDNWQRAETMAVSPDGTRLVLYVGGQLAEWNDPARPSEEPRRRDRDAATALANSRRAPTITRSGSRTRRSAPTSVPCTAIWTCSTR